MLNKILSESESESESVKGINRRLWIPITKKSTVYSGFPLQWVR